MNVEKPGMVMIVDDTPETLAFLSDALDLEGYEVLVAPSGLSALKQLELVRPDVILLDALMPGIDGFETCRRLKSGPETKDIPVIFMTALAATEDIVRGLGEGAEDYVTKPVREEEVLARIATHIARSKVMRRAHRTVEALPRASLTADARGAVTWQSSRAAELLRSCGTDSLPDEVKEWVVACQRSVDGPGRSLKVTLGGRKVLIEYCGDIEGGESLLFCEAVDLAAEEPLARAFGLTPRESEVLRWVAAGKTNRDIGAILGMSPRTVTKHLEHIFAKLGVETRTAAASRAMSLLGGGR